MPLHLFKDRKRQPHHVCRTDHRHRHVRRTGLPARLPADGHRPQRHRRRVLHDPPDGGAAGHLHRVRTVVQSSSPVSRVGTATASNNYFRQIGASLGSAIVASLSVARLTERLPAGSASGGAGSNSLTPEVVKTLPPRGAEGHCRRLQRRPHPGLPPYGAPRPARCGRPDLRPREAPGHHDPARRRPRENGWATVACVRPGRGGAPPGRQRRPGCGTAPAWPRPDRPAGAAAAGRPGRRRRRAS